MTSGACTPGWARPIPAGPRRASPSASIPSARCSKCRSDPGATQIGYIFHRGDTKDPGADQFLDFAKYGYEVWQLQGADVAKSLYLAHPDHRRTKPGEHRGAARLLGQRRHHRLGCGDRTRQHLPAVLRTRWRPAGYRYRHHRRELPDPDARPRRLARRGEGKVPAPSRAAGVEDRSLPTWRKCQRSSRARSPSPALTPDGVPVDATGLQIPGVLDDLFTYNGALGVSWHGGITHHPALGADGKVGCLAAVRQLRLRQPPGPPCR